ncbi:YjjG family noncanonical pyrimidine nucleotidase, partial [Clostridium perfringens]
MFYADETLFDFKKSEKKSFKKAMLDFNIAYYENYHLKVYKEIITAIWKEFEQGLSTQQTLKIEIFKRLSDKLNIN